MGDRKQALTDLLAKVEAGYPWHGNPGESVVWAFGPLHRGIEDLEENAKWSKYGDLIKGCCHGSLDAAKALHEAVLPGWRKNIGEDEHSVWASLTIKRGS